MAGKNAKIPVVVYAMSSYNRATERQEDIDRQLTAAEAWLAATENCYSVAVVIEVSASKPSRRPRLEQVIKMAHENGAILLMERYSTMGKQLSTATIWERKIVDLDIPVYYSTGGFLDPRMTSVREQFGEEERQHRRDMIHNGGMQDPARKQEIEEKRNASVRARWARIKGGNMPPDEEHEEE